MSFGRILKDLMKPKDYDKENERIKKKIENERLKLELDKIRSEKEEKRTERGGYENAHFRRY